MKKAAGVAPVLVSILLLAACGGGGSEAAGLESKDTGASSSAESSGSPTPTVAPATGRKVRVDALTVRFPDSYFYVRRQGGFGWMGLGPGGDTLSVAEIDAGLQKDDETLERRSRDLGLWRGHTPQRGDNVEVDGVSMLHLHGRGGARSVCGPVRRLRR
ncbi:hypothetical protein ACFP3Q_06425 [Nocardioides sp. GCM10027113]|uniref:hypothetical protein n=1 Tax=unclassified Nocardioides TaxID=2615069 RepID=UPI00361EB7A8